MSVALVLRGESQAQVVVHVILGHFPHPQSPVHVVVVEHKPQMSIRAEIIHVGSIVHDPPVATVAAAFAFGKLLMIQMGDVDVGDVTGVCPMHIPNIAAP